MGIITVLPLLLLSNLAHAVFPTQVQVFAELNGTRVPLAEAIATDQNGRQFLADPKGKLDLRLAAGSVQIQMDSPYIAVERVGQIGGSAPYSKTLSARQVSEGTEVVFTDADAPMHARQCRINLQSARDTYLNSLPLRASADGIYRTIVCSVDYDKGCGPIRTGDSISLPAGEARCRASAEVADLAYHEYGHVVVDALLAPGVPRHESVTEAMSDILATLKTGNPRFGSGFWLNRQISWLRDLSKPVNFTSLNTYEEALMLSSAWWQLYEAVTAQIGPARGAQATLRAVLASIPLIRHTSAHPLANAAIAAIEAIRSDSETSTIPGMVCAARRIFAKQGFVQLSRECLSTSSELRGHFRAGDRWPRVTGQIHNDSLFASPPLSVRVEIDSRSYTSPVGSIGPKGTGNISIPLTRISTPQSTLSTAIVEIRTQEGELLERTSIIVPRRSVLNEQEIVLDLLSGLEASRVSIPDPSGQAATGGLAAAIELPVPSVAHPGDEIAEAWLEFETNHNYSDDLLFSAVSPDGRAGEFFKGLLEFPIPRIIPIPSPNEFLRSEPGKTPARILVRDIAAGSSGKILLARLHLRLLKLR